MLGRMSHEEISFILSWSYVRVGSCPLYCLLWTRWYLLGNEVSLVVTSNRI